MAAVAARRADRPVAETLAADVVCFPDMDWDHPVWTNRQHVMLRLARSQPGVRVLYVSPPRFALSGRVARRRLRRPELPETSRPDGRWTTRVGERLWVLQPPLPVPNRLAARLAPRLLERWTLRAVRRTTARLGFARPCLWLYSPLAAPFVGRLDERLVVYDVVDDYASLPEYAKRGPRAAALDEELTRRADLVLAASRPVFEERARLTPRIAFVGNGADVGLFAAARDGAPPAPPDLEGLPRPLIGFHGSLSAYKLDAPLLRALAERRPDWTFVLVGPETDRETRGALAGLANVRLLGARTQGELPAYLAAFAVSVIPYRRSRYTERLNALKLFECLAAGTPVVATDLACFRDVPGVAVAEGADAFEAAIERALAGGRRAELPDPEAFSWEAKVERVVAALADPLERTGA